MSVAGTTVDPSRTLPALRAIETAFSTSVLHPAVLGALRDLGVGIEDVADINTVTRSAAMRTVNPALVWSAFFNPNPSVIERLVPAIWEKVSFDDVLDAQRNALDEPFRTAAAAMPAGELAELSGLCRTVTETAMGHCEGRPLFAGLASLPLPADDHMMVWHASRLLREHRGDGHIAALVVEGLGRVDALVVHAAMLPAMADGLRRSRRWSVEEWEASIEDLRRRGWLTDDEAPTFTAVGQARRQWIEDRTDELAAVAFEPIGDEGMERMIVLGTTYTACLEAVGLGRGLRAAIPLGD